MDPTTMQIYNMNVGLTYKFYIHFLQLFNIEMPHSQYNGCWWSDELSVL